MGVYCFMISSQPCLHIDLMPEREMQSADKILKEVYKKANTESKFKCSYYPGPHKFDKSMQKEAFDWFDQWLKG